MTTYLRTRALAILLLLTASVTAACVVIVSRNRMLPLAQHQYGTTVNTPFRVHMKDGGVIVFQGGAYVGQDRVVGMGTRYSATLEETRARFEVPMDSVLGIEAFNREARPATILSAPVSLIASTAGAAFGTAALLVAIFGSCPTIYVDSAGTPALQAESFSYSIAPLLSKRDVDRLDVRPDSDGIIRLDVRNEALETHYIDQLELLEAQHDSDEIVVPAARSGFVALRDPQPVTRVLDAAGRDVARQLRAADGSVFSSDNQLLRRAAAGEAPAEDHLDITIARPGGGDSLAVLFTMRSSLLSTAVFYDHMLAHHGARALDWIGRDLSHITTVAQVARWYTSNFGLRVLVRDGDDWKPVVRLMDFGPVAWRSVAAIVPRVRGDSVRLRLAFAPDEFRIDRVALAWEMRAVTPRTVPLVRVTDRERRDRADLRDALRRADDRPLMTLPGERFFAYYQTAPAPSGTRTYLVAADGYYVEWVRGSWIGSARDTLPFSPRTDVRDVLRTWLAGKDSLEALFFTNRVPVP